MACGDPDVHKITLESVLETQFWQKIVTIVTASNNNFSLYLRQSLIYVQIWHILADIKDYVFLN